MYNLYGAPPESKMTRPALSIVIATGHSSLRIGQQVRRMYLHGDSRRKAAAAFYQLLPGDLDDVTLTELADIADTGWSPDPEADFLEARRRSLSSMVKHASKLKTQLEQAFHEQRVHENTIYAGWADKFQIWLNVFILGNTKDPWAAGALAPLSVILNHVLTSTRLCRSHWLLDIAVFPEDKPDEDIAVFSFMQALDALLQPGSKEYEKLASTMKVPLGQEPDFAVYLCDSRKEGSTKVGGQTNLDILMGNALLALLEEETASKFFTRRSVDARERWAGYYSSIGATVLVQDPDALQMACAKRCAHTFLHDRILCPPRDGQKGIQLVSQVQEKLGSITSWLVSLTLKLPAHFGQMNIKSDLSEMTAYLTDLHLSPLDYERVNQTPWVKELLSYDDNFQQVSIPLIAVQMVDHEKELKASLVGILTEAFKKLPLEPELYPGGVQNARLVLKMLVEGFGQTSVDLNKLRERLPSDISIASSRLDSRRSEMEKILTSIPDLPWWARILPTYVRKWVAMGVMTLFHWRKLYLANEMQRECIALLQQVCGLRIVQQTVENLIKIPPDLQNQTEETMTALADLETKLSGAKGTFPAEWGEFPLGAVENGYDKLFRQVVTGRELADWSYAKWMPDIDTWSQDFIAARPLFDDWRTVKQENIVAWIEEKGAQAYKPVWTLTLENIFSMWANGTEGFPKGKILSQATVRECMLAAIPPARPNFDAVGGSHGAVMTCHGIVGDPNWRYCRLPLEGEEVTRWELITSDDPYVLLCMNVHHNFSLQSLVESFQEVRSKLEVLPAAQRQAYELLTGFRMEPPPSVEPVDPDSLDLEYKTFEWEFAPRGSKKKVAQKIELAISKSRFEFYRRQPRLTGEWNAYPEEDMPEIRKLAAEFQKLHSIHNWGTFNQAYNVLQFVQSIITYTSDEGTTGHSEWPRFPIETLMEGRGDCEDVAILCAAVIARLGFQVVLFDYPGHMAFGVAGADSLKGDYLLDPKTGRRYYYGEATADGWVLGKIPEGYRNITLEGIIPVNILMKEDKPEVD